MKSLLSTSGDPLLLVLRLVLGAIFFAHGSQKALGWFGGAGFHGTMHSFTAGLHIPAFFAVLAIVAEFAGGLGLLLGLLSRIAAFGIAVVMLVAIFKVHLANGLLGRPGHAGYEFPLALLAIAFLILVRGAGPLSVDRALSREEEHLLRPVKM